MFYFIKDRRDRKLKERLVMAAMSNRNCDDPAKWAKEAYDFICARRVITMTWRD